MKEFSGDTRPPLWGALKPSHQLPIARGKLPTTTLPVNADERKVTGFSTGWCRGDRQEWATWADMRERRPSAVTAGAARSCGHPGYQACNTCRTRRGLG